MLRAWTGASEPAPPGRGRPSPPLLPLADAWRSASDGSSAAGGGGEVEYAALELRIHPPRVQARGARPPPLGHRRAPQRPPATPSAPAP